MPIQMSTFLRRAERDDLDTVVAWMEDPDFAQFLYGDPGRSPRQIREQIVAMLGRAAGHTMPGGIYLIIDSKESGPIGLISIQNLSWRNRSCTLDVYVGRKEMRSTFVAGLCAYRAFQYCFEELNLNRVGAFIYSFNSASWRLMERTGAVRELTLRDQVARNGKRYDVYGYGLLRSEYEAMRARYAGIRGMGLEGMVRELAGEEASEAP